MKVVVLRKKRKKIFQDDTKGYVVDEYTGKKLNKDGTMHLDHVVSAKKIHDDLSLRMVTSAEERDRIATDDKNLAKTYSSLNQSKGEKDFEQWANSINRKDKTKTNAEYYEVDSARAQEKVSIAEQHIESSRKKATYNHYIDSIKEQGINRGFQSAKRQVVGLFIYECAEVFFRVMVPFVREWNTYSCLSDRIYRFQELLQQAIEHIKNNVWVKFKGLLQAFTSGFVSGFSNTVLMTFVNMFTTTASSMGKILLASLDGIMGAMKMVFQAPKNMSKEEIFKNALKIIGAAIIAVLGTIFTESVEFFIKTHLPFLAPISDIIANIVSALMIGICCAILFYTIDNFSTILKDFGKLIGLNMSAKEIEKKYQAFLDRLSDIHQELLETIVDEYRKIGNLCQMCGDFNKSSLERFQISIKYAEAVGVKGNRILKSEQDFDDFFNN